MDALPDVLNSFGKRKNRNDFSKFIFCGELDVVPGYRIERVRGIVSITFSTFFGHVRISILGNTSTKGSATGVDTTTGENTNVKNRTRSKVPQELVIVQGSDGDDLVTRGRMPCRGSCIIRVLVILAQGLRERSPQTVYTAATTDEDCFPETPKLWSLRGDLEPMVTGDEGV